MWGTCFRLPFRLTFPSLSNTFQILEKAEHRTIKNVTLLHHEASYCRAHHLAGKKQNGVGSGRAAHAGPSPEIPAAVARSQPPKVRSIYRISSVRRPRGRAAPNTTEQRFCLRTEPVAIAKMLSEKDRTSLSRCIRYGIAVVSAV
jgi:hypothetical protein